MNEESEPDDYDARDDMARSYEDCLAAVRDRVAAGGPGWGGAHECRKPVLCTSSEATE